jgi:prophage regulatory protein
MQNLNTGEDEKLLRLKQVLEIIPVSKSSWWAGVKDGKYPASVKYGRSTFWLNSDIRALIHRISTGTFVPQKMQRVNPETPFIAGPNS